MEFFKEPTIFFCLFCDGSCMWVLLMVWGEIGYQKMLWTRRLIGRAIILRNRWQYRISLGFELLKVTSHCFPFLLECGQMRFQLPGFEYLHFGRCTHIICITNDLSVFLGSTFNIMRKEGRKELWDMCDASVDRCLALDNRILNGIHPLVENLPDLETANPLLNT